MGGRNGARPRRGLTASPLHLRSFRQGLAPDLALPGIPSHRGDIPSGTLRSIRWKSWHVGPTWPATSGTRTITGRWSDGQTLPKACKRIRHALALLLDAPEDSFDIVDDVVLPAPVRRALRSYESRKEQAQAKQREVEAAQRAAAKALEQHGLSLRDAGEILGLTGARVQQVLAR